MEAIVEEICHYCCQNRVYNPRDAIEILGFDFNQLMAHIQTDNELGSYLLITYYACRYRCLEDHLIGIISRKDAIHYILEIEDDIKTFLQDVNFPTASDDT